MSTENTLSTIVDSLDESLPKMLREERLKRDWSLTDLANNSGVSRAMVHKLETGKSSPTAALLGKLSGAFGLTVSQLLNSSDSLEKASFVRKADRRVWQDPETGYLREQVVGGAKAGEGNGIDIVRVTLPPGQTVDYPSESFRFIRQSVLVEKGNLQFREGKKNYDMMPGDCLSLGAPEDCQFHNSTSEPCTYLVVVYRQ